jgi:DNA-binding NarL/FixJ family response regulator
MTAATSTRIDVERLTAAEAAIHRLVDEAQDCVARSKVLTAQLEIMMAANALRAARAGSEELSQIAADLDEPLLQAMAARASGSILLAEGGARAACDALGRAWAAWRELDAPCEAIRIGSRVEKARGATSGRTNGLSSRELQVLRLITAGRTNKSIAIELVLSERTVDRHVSNIFTKLGVSSRAAATAYAYEHRLV